MKIPNEFMCKLGDSIFWFWQITGGQITGRPYYSMIEYTYITQTLIGGKYVIDVEWLRSINQRNCTQGTILNRTLVC